MAIKRVPELGIGFRFLLRLTPTNIDIYQPKIPRRPENANFGLFWPKNGSPCAFGKLAIKRDPDLAIDFRLLRRLTNAHIYNAGPKSPAAPKTQNLAKICVL